MSGIEKHTGFILFIWMVLFPCIAFAAKGCRVIEYPDHIEAVCAGDPDYTLKQREQTGSDMTPTKGAEASRKRQRISDIRSLNAHRFDAVEEQSAQDTTEKKK